MNCNHLFVLCCLFAVSLAQLGGFSGPCSASSINGNALLPISIFSTNENAQVSNFGCSYSAQVSGTTWFSVQTEAGVSMNVTTCSEYTDFDTYISVFSGSCSSPTCVAYDDDSSCSYGSGASLVSWVSNGDEYLIGVTGYNSNEGNFELIFSRSHSVEIDSSCINAIPLGSSFFPPKVVDGSNENGVTYHQESCGLYDTYPVIWYSIVPSSSAPITVSTCNDYTNFDTYISVFNGTCGILQCVTNNDDGCESSSASVVTFTPEVGKTYHIAVFGFGGNTGNYQLIVSQPVGVECGTTSTTILSSTTYDRVVISNTDLVPITQSVCASEYGPAYWMPFISTTSGSMTVTTCDSTTNFDTYLSVYKGICINFTCVTYDDDVSCTSAGNASEVTFDVDENELFFVVLTGYAGSTGTAGLRYTFTAN